MVNMQLLEEKMKEKNISVSEMAKCLSINESTWYRKRKVSQSFSIGEAEQICKRLQLTKEETNDIFFAN